MVELTFSDLMKILIGSSIVSTNYYSHLLQLTVMFNSHLESFNSVECFSH